MSKRTTFELWPWIVLCGQLLAGWRAERNYRMLPEVVPTSRSDKFEEWPGISIIVPARNEETNLPRLLESLVVQDYPLYEIIVVDDASTDATACIVQSYVDRGVRLVPGEGPPAGWTGKNFACWSGAKESRYPWLLFVDADTELAPLALYSALAYALKRHAGALSLFTYQRCDSFWERLLLPFAYQQFFMSINVRRIHQQCGPALANGQYFLMLRSAYQQAGGHGAIAGSLIDDVALATRLKEIGVIPLACRGEKLVSVRMYTDLKAINEGFGKNSYLFLRHSPVTGMQTAASTWLSASVGVLFATALHKRSRVHFVLACVAYLAQMAGLSGWLRRFGVKPVYILLAPLSALVFLGIALNSMLRVLTGRPLSWKGRGYPGKQKKEVEALSVSHSISSPDLFPV